MQHIHNKSNLKHSAAKSLQLGEGVKICISGLVGNNPITLHIHELTKNISAGQEM